MIKVRHAEDRGRFDHGWLQTAHTFSFADYHDPAHMRFRSLRVINEDVIAPGRGFGMHPHRDMEILTWILSGALRHEDSMGHGEVLRTGEVQVMSAGTGVMHSEHNASDTEPCHLLQIWLMPKKNGIEPRYEQQVVERSSMQGTPRLLAAPPGGGGLTTIHQDVRLSVVELAAGQRAEFALAPGRSAWVQLARGSARLDDVALQQGDGAAVTAAAGLVLEGTGAEPAEALVFDLA